MVTAGTGLIYSTASIGGSIVALLLFTTICGLYSDFGSSYVADHRYGIAAFFVLFALEVSAGEMIGRVLCDGQLGWVGPGASTKAVKHPGLFSLCYLTLSLFFFVL